MADNASRQISNFAPQVQVIDDATVALDYSPLPSFHLLEQEIDVIKKGFPIAQQHSTECLYDTIQNILMFADVYKDIVRPFIDYLIRKYDLRSSVRTPLEKLRKIDYDDIRPFLYGPDPLRHVNMDLILFFQTILRRNIGITEYSSGPITRRSAETRARTYTASLIRSPSINRSAGKKAKEYGIAVCGGNALEMFKQINQLDPFVGKILMSTEWQAEKAETFIAVYHEFKGGTQSYNPDGSERAYFPDLNHAVGIIRRGGSYFLIDNEIGVAIPIEPAIFARYDGRNLKLKLTRHADTHMGTIEYSIGDIIFYGRSVGDKNITEKEIITGNFNEDRSHNIYLYQAGMAAPSAAPSAGMAAAGMAAAGMAAAGMGGYRRPTRKSKKRKTRRFRQSK